MVNTILMVAGAIMMLALIITIIRFAIGPSPVDRVISFDTMSIISLAIIVLLSFLKDRFIYIDVAIIYGLLSYVGVIIVAKYIEKGL